MTDLIPLEDIKAPVLFSNDDEVNAVTERVEKAARSVVFDINTTQGRKEAASVAAKVARSKTYLDGLGKDLVSEIKEKAKVIDGRRKNIRDTLDALKAEVRKPLTEFEEKEKTRIADHKTAIEDLNALCQDAPIQQAIIDLEEIFTRADTYMDRDFEEYSDRAIQIFDKISEAVTKRRQEIKQAIAQAAEIERLQKEAKEREQSEREERIAREAAEKATREDIEKLRAAEDAKIAAEKAALEAERRALEEAKRAEEDRLESIRQAEIAKQEAERQAKEAAERAVEEERARAEEAKRVEAEQTAKREANKKHRAMINNEALESLIAAGVSKTAAKAVVTAIAQGKIQHITITY